MSSLMCSTLTVERSSLECRAGCCLSLELWLDLVQVSCTCIVCTLLILSACAKGIISLCAVFHVHCSGWGTWDFPPLNLSFSPQALPTSAIYFPTPRASCPLPCDLKNHSFKSYGIVSFFDGHWRSLLVTDTKIGTYNMNSFWNGESLTTLLSY